MLRLGDDVHIEEKTMSDELSKRVMKRFSEQLRSRADQAQGSPGSAPECAPGLPPEGTAQGQLVPRNISRNTRLAAIVRDQEPASRWTRCARCRADVEVITANDHRDQGRCPRCRRLI